MIESIKLTNGVDATFLSAHFNTKAFPPVRRLTVPIFRNTVENYKLSMMPVQYRRGEKRFNELNGTAAC
jgi:hypothetical protein